MTLALALGMASGFLTKSNKAKEREVVDKYPNGFNKTRENSRRLRRGYKLTTEMKGPIDE